MLGTVECSGLDTWDSSGAQVCGGHLRKLQGETEDKVLGCSGARGQGFSTARMLKSAISVLGPLGTWVLETSGCSGHSRVRCSRARDYRMLGPRHLRLLGCLPSGKHLRKLQETMEDKGAQVLEDKGAWSLGCLDLLQRCPSARELGARVLRS